MPEERGISFLPKEARNKKEEKRDRNETKKEGVKLTIPQESKSILPQKKKVSLFFKIKSFFNKRKALGEVKIREEKVVVGKKILGKEEYSIPTTGIIPPEEQVEVSFVSLEKTTVSKERIGLLCLILSGAISLLIVAGLYFTFKISESINNQKIVSLNKEAENIEQKIKNSGLKEFKGKIKILESKIKKAGDLLDEHIYWTNFFSLLEKYTLPEIRYSGLNADFSKNISLKTTSYSYYSAAKQLLVFQTARDFVKEVGVSGLKLTRDKERSMVSFSLDLLLKDDVFKSKNR